MPRPRKRRLIREQPAITLFKPQGVPAHDLKGVVLPLEGLEALRLADALGLDQDEAAGLMGISKPTFCRVLAGAREAVARALVNGWSIRIEGGDYRLVEDEAPFGPGGGRGMGRGRGGRGGGGRGRGSGGGGGRGGRGPGG